MLKVDPNTDNIVWNVSRVFEAAFLQSLSPPVVSQDDSKVFAATWKHLWCVDTKTGAVLWNFTDTTSTEHTQGIAEYPNPAPVLSPDGKIVYFYSLSYEGLYNANATLYGVEVETGKQVWSVAFVPGDTSSTFTVGEITVNPLDGSVYVVDQHGLYSLNGLSGKQQWQYSNGTWGVFTGATPDETGKFVYFAPSGVDVYQVNAKTGNVDYIVNTGGTISPIYFAATVRDGVLYSMDGYWDVAAYKIPFE
eukprot:TRINITY_DN1988_c0_g1_i1.p1 TRINITY_DN1988_c0_g1~~TRINITY_DN1988_c0_g1_i1.p1  ORF type:complete len:249 (-),score=40.83 TRINITY_DN1988_c0_g1_i1:53-799(-)